MSFRSAIYLVMSPRPQVGRTLVARLLLDFFLFNAREAEAFDLNDEGDLPRCFPAHAEHASIAGIKEQMALFDRLIAGDGTNRIVDIGPLALRPFLDVLRDTGFALEARERRIAPVVLFIASDDAASRRCYDRLVREAAGLIVVPVLNEMIGVPQQRYPASTATVRLPALAPGLRPYIDPPFTFSGPRISMVPMTVGLELQRWMRKIFVEFRELDLRILLADLQQRLLNPA